MIQGGRKNVRPHTQIASSFHSWTMEFQNEKWQYYNKFEHGQSNYSSGIGIEFRITGPTPYINTPTKKWEDTALLPLHGRSFFVQVLVHVRRYCCNGQKVVLSDLIDPLPHKKKYILESHDILVSNSTILDW